MTGLGWFILGVFVGSTIGIITMAALVASRGPEDNLDIDWKKEWDD